MAQNVHLKVFFNLCKFWCLLFAIINNNFQHIVDYFLLESSEMDCMKGQQPPPLPPPVGVIGWSHRLHLGGGGMMGGGGVTNG